jgi:hypothetical protein
MLRLTRPVEELLLIRRVGASRRVFSFKVLIVKKRVRFWDLGLSNLQGLSDLILEAFLSPFDLLSFLLPHLYHVNLCYISLQNSLWDI